MMLESSGWNTIGNVHCHRLLERPGGFTAEEQRVHLDIARPSVAPVEARQQRALAAA